MAAFRFRFESLLDLKQRLRDEAGLEVGKAHEAIARVQQQIETLNVQREELRQQAASQLSGNGQEGLSSGRAVDQMLVRGRYDMQLAAELASLNQAHSTLQVELQRRRDVLIEAEADVKRLQRLRETQAKSHRDLEMKKAQQEADDLTSARLICRQRQEKRQNQAKSQSTQNEASTPVPPKRVDLASNRISLSRWAQEQSE